MGDYKENLDLIEKVEIYKPEDFDFLPKSQRVLAARQFNEGATTVCRCLGSSKKGSWEIPEFSPEHCKRIHEILNKVIDYTQLVYRGPEDGH